MRGKVAKKIRKLVKHLNQEIEYNIDEQPVRYTKEEDGTVLRHKGTPRTIVETNARSVYKRLKRQYVRH